jgi:Zn-dependent protease with chaperone function
MLFYVGLVVGSAYLCWYSFASLRSGTEVQTSTFWWDLQDILRQEARVRDTYHDAADQGPLRKEDADNHLLRTLEREVLPQWRIARQRLERLKDVPSNARPFVQQLTRSMQLREEGWELLAGSLRKKDQRSAEQSRQKLQQADQISRQMRMPAPPPPPGKRDDVFVYVILGIASGVLCLFLVKGFFKRQRVNPPLRVEVTEKDQPVLFAFIRRLCQDTSAPFPRRVYLTPDVNAAVCYDESILNLFMPASKNLIIGLGLVNHLTLNEFKAVLAHEFGHFSQNSMKLGNYVYVSNRVIGDLVFGRDWLDTVLATLNRIDIRTAILWGVRKLLQGLFHVINFANLALSREMEYNADLVAVSVTGSDALIHALARLNFASDCLNQAFVDLTAAGDHQLYTTDLFYHQERAVDYVRALRKDPRLGEPPPLPDDPAQRGQVFQPEDTTVPRMWATHPSNYDREQNAKEHYIRSPVDERSPWILFEETEAVRAELTRKFYEAGKPNQPLSFQAPEVVQAFIDAEHAETIYHPRYHGLYDNRYLTPGDLNELLRAGRSEVPTIDRLAQSQEALYNDVLKDRMAVHRERQQECDLLARLANGAVELTGKDFQFRGARYKAKEASQWLTEVQKELDEDFVWMGALDRQVLLVHLDMARPLQQNERAELEDRYRFHLGLQQIHRELSAQNQQVQVTLGQLAGAREIPQEQFQAVIQTLQQAHDVLKEKLEAADDMRLPAMKNMQVGEPLGPFLLSQPLVHRPQQGQSSLDGAWIGQFLGQLGEVMDKARRIHFKSVGGILALQEKIVERWTALSTTRHEATGK